MRRARILRLILSKVSVFPMRAIREIVRLAAAVVLSLCLVSSAIPAVKIVGSDQDLLRTVEAMPGAVGIVDVYAINSAVKVLRVDGKLPFDVGYALKGN